MFYIIFNVKSVANCRRIARVSVDDGSCFNVPNGAKYRMPAGRAHTLKIYQSPNKKSRKTVAWTVPLSGKKDAYCTVDLFPYMSDPRKTGAPNFAHNWTPMGTYKQDMQHAAQTMTRGEYNVYMAGRRIAEDNFSRSLRNALPVPMSTNLRPLLFLLPFFIWTATLYFMATSQEIPCYASAAAGLLFLILAIVQNKK